MEDFKVHHLISEMIRILGIQEKVSGTLSCDAYAEHLKKNQMSYVTTRASSVSALKKLSSKSSSSDYFLKRYDDMKTKNFREVDSSVHLLYEISCDEKVKRFLNQSLHNLMGNSDGKSNGSTINSSKLAVKEYKTFGTQMITSESIEPCHKDSKKVIVPSGIYKFPLWFHDHPYISWDFIFTSNINNFSIGPIGVLPKNIQEPLFVSDLLSCFAGVEGHYITVHHMQDSPNAKTFCIDKTADSGILQLTERILPVLTDYSIITHFVEEKSHFECGMVNHALCAAIQDMIKDYFILVAQLEQQYLMSSLSLQKMWFYLQPTMRKLRVVADVAVTMCKGEYHGGMVLSILHEKAFSLIGDAIAREIYFHLAKCASVPYFEIMEKWIYKGIISDPYAEFIVEDNELIKKDDLPMEYSDDYWEKRYTIRREQIPVFLEKYADMILRTGKYLNVIRQCGHNIKFPSYKTLSYTMKEQLYFEKIFKAYQFASERLLHLLMAENDLKGRLRSLKHYFLLDQGDFIVQFMDMAEEELCKDIDDIMPTRLESLLELALRTSAVNCDKYKDDVKVELLPYDLLTQLFKILMISPDDQKGYGIIADVPITGLEALSFDYEVHWPLSLVINKRTLACYQMLFRHLFYCKYVEGLLVRIWTLNKTVKMYSFGSSTLYSAAFALRHRMLHFIQNLDYYITFEVIAPHWESFRRKMLQVLNVDDVLECHNDFLNNCLSDSMLTFPKLLQVIGKLLKLCISFSSFMQNVHKQDLNQECIGMAEFVSGSAMQDERCEGKNGSESSFQQGVSNFQKEFDFLFIRLLEMISDFNATKSSTKMSHMLYRLDYNGFYVKNNQSFT